MDFSYTGEQEELGKAIRDLLERKALDVVLNNAVYEEYDIKPEEQEGEVATVSAQAVASAVRAKRRRGARDTEAQCHATARPLITTPKASVSKYREAGALVAPRT